MPTPNSQLRSSAPVGVFFLLFGLCIAGAYAWFNTDISPGIGDRSSELGVSIQNETNSQLPSPNSQTNSHPRLWLSARTNIPGYVFVPEPVSESVRKTLGTTNILSGTFYKIGDRSLEIGDGVVMSDVRRSTNFHLPTPISQTNSQLPSPISQTNSQLLTSNSQFPLSTDANQLPSPNSHLPIKTLGTTNILNGTFVPIGDRSLEYANRKNKALA